MSELRLHVDSSRYDSRNINDLAHDVCSLATNLDLTVVFEFKGGLYAASPEEPIEELKESLQMQLHRRGI